MSLDGPNRKGPGSLEADATGAGAAGEFSPFEAALITAGRDDALPTPRRELILHNIAVGIGAPLGVGETDAPDVGGAGPTRGLGETSALTGQGLLAKTVGAVAIAGVAVWAGWQGMLASQTPNVQGTSQVNARTSPDEALDRAPDAPIAPREADEAALGSQVDPAADAPSEAVSTPAAIEESSAGKGARKARPASDTLAQELGLIDSARAALLRGDPASALRVLANYRRQFPRGALQAEATVQRVEALIASGDKSSASKIGDAFLKRHPDSPYSRRIASLLGVSRDASEGARRAK